MQIFTRSLLATLFIGTFAARVHADLPEGKNRELVMAMCSGCHSLKLVEQNAMSRERWDRTLQGMEKRHNLVFNSSELRTQILDYLGTYLGAKETQVDQVSGLPLLHLNLLAPSSIY
jgi:hypothetical protein